MLIGEELDYESFEVEKFQTALLAWIVYHTWFVNLLCEGPDIGVSIYIKTCME
jgi:hypothetical protein